MDQPVRSFPPDRADTRRLIGRVIVAVILGEAIWALIVSVMNNLIVPWLGDVMGQSSGLPTSFVQRPYNYPDLFVTIIEACIAGLAAAFLNYFVQRPQTQRVKSVKSSPLAGPVRMFPESVKTPAPSEVLVDQPSPSQAVQQPVYRDTTPENQDVAVLSAEAVASCARNQKNRTRNPTQPTNPCSSGEVARVNAPTPEMKAAPGLLLLRRQQQSLRQPSRYSRRQKPSQLNRRSPNRFTTTSSANPCPPDDE